MLVIHEDQINPFFEEIGKAAVLFDVRDDVVPFKQYFIPPVEEILTVNKRGKIFHPMSSGKFVLHGLSLPDLEALTQLDHIMSKPEKDYFYLRRRKKALVIGITEEKLDAMPGGDIVFQSVGDGQYKVWSRGLKGRNTIKNNSRFFRDVEDTGIEYEPPQIPEGDTMEGWSHLMRKLLLDPGHLAEIVDWSRDHDIWNELGERCIGCGICTYVCPLCFCFSVEDRIGLNDVRSRFRRWDACTLPGFAKIAGGHNFRPTLKERYYNWFYHKFVRGYLEYGKSLCVGCGRCKELCPASINIQEVLRLISVDFKKNA